MWKNQNLKNYQYFNDFCWKKKCYQIIGNWRIFCGDSNPQIYQNTTNLESSINFLILPKYHNGNFTMEKIQEFYKVAPVA